LDLDRWICRRCLGAEWVISGGDCEYLSAGSPIERDDTTIYKGARHTLDYRSLILERIHLTYEFGVAHLEDFDYDRLFAATDSLFDAGEILFIAKSKSWPKDELVAKLWMYGVLQALAVQQDAAEQLMKCFGLKGLTEESDVLENIKELRIAAVGHPSEHNKKRLKYKGCTFLSHRVLGQLHQFRIVTYIDFKKSLERIIDVPELVEKQQVALALNLVKVWNMIKADNKYDRPE
jgi:hypothetical protein